MTKLLKRLQACFLNNKEHHYNQKPYVEFTGEPPLNPSEVLIKEIAGERKSVSFHWLKDQISDALYHTELRQGAMLTDIGILGPCVFCNEASRVLADMRPEFAHISGAPLS